MGRKFGGRRHIDDIAAFSALHANCSALELVVGDLILRLAFRAEESHGRLYSGDIIVEAILRMPVV